MMVVKRKQVILISLLCLILLAGYLNWSYQGRIEDSVITSNEEGLSSSISSEDQSAGETTETANSGGVKLVDEGQSTDKNDFFAQARLDRETSKSKAIETFKTIIESENTTPEAKKEAESEVSKIAKSTALETSIENLIKAKGFSDVVVYVKDDIINVVVKSEGLSKSEIAKIQDIVVQMANVPVDKIKIIEVK